MSGPSRAEAYIDQDALDQINMAVEITMPVSEWKVLRKHLQEHNGDHQAVRQFLVYIETLLRTIDERTAAQIRLEGWSAQERSPGTIAEEDET